QLTLTRRDPLGRDRDAAHQAFARKVNCATFKPVHVGDSCDEYAFAASTYSAYWAGGPPNTRVESVPASQNSLLGSLLSGMFVTQRVLDPDVYYITTVP
ncbi:MAG: hypothetical protein DLM58_24340, partial [Pseudonocardiales bacterium]